MANFYNTVFQQQTDIDLSRVRPDFRDDVRVKLLNHLLKGKELKDFKPTQLNAGEAIAGGSFMELCQASFKFFDEGVVEELLKLSGGKRPSAGPGEILLTTLFSNVRYANKGDVVISGKTCEIKSIRGGGGPYSREQLLDKLALWSQIHRIDLSDVDWNPSGIGALLPHLAKMGDEAMADLAPLLVGEETAEVAYNELKKAEDLGPKILLQHLGACQLKGYCDRQGNANLLIVFPEEKKYLFLPNNEILKISNYLRFGGWSQFGFLISKLLIG